MRSGGRRAAERRVGDEEMEEENNRILVVKSDEKWMKFRKEAVIASLILELMWCFLLKPPVVFAIVSPPMIGLVYSLFSWIQDSKVLTLNETGCCIKCFLYKKMYTWDELKNRQMRVKYGDYKESILMSTNAIPEGKYKCAMFMFQHPFNSFVINFCGLHEPFYFGTGKNGSRTYVVEGEVCAIDKDLFFKKMKEWGVAIEKVRVMDESIFYDKSGGICTRRNGYGWKIFSFVLVLIMCACLMFPIVVLKDMGMLFISIPFGIVFLIVYKVIISRKSYCLKMDEKGCTRKFLFLSKHYQWKNLRVKLVASEESHCGEGVLFIKKKSGNSSSASETFSYASLHPYSSFVANFEVFGKMYGEKDALHEINKELFLEKMKEWGVEVEGLPKEE